MVMVRVRVRVACLLGELGLRVELEGEQLLLQPPQHLGMVDARALEFGDHTHHLLVRLGRGVLSHDAVSVGMMSCSRGSMRCAAVCGSMRCTAVLVLEHTVHPCVCSMCAVHAQCMCGGVSATCSRVMVELVCSRICRSVSRRTPTAASTCLEMSRQRRSTSCMPPVISSRTAWVVSGEW